MGRYLLKRVLQMIPVLLIITFVIFVLVHITGDPTATMLPADAPASARELLRESLGLDKPMLEQYYIYMRNLLTGDFGTSFSYNAPAFEIVAERVPASLQLAGVSLLLSVVIAIPLGILSAKSQNSPFDFIVSGFSVLGQAMPSFWIGLMLILLFAVEWRILPVSGSGTWQHLVLPSVTLAIGTAAQIIPLIRSSMLEIMHEDYIRTARAKGLSELKITTKHVFKNALIPVVTMIALQLPRLIGQALITETVFSWPGIGQLMVQGIGRHDMTIVQACVLFIAFITILANLVADLAYCLIDPRIKY